VLIRHLRQLKTIVLQHWCLIHAVLLGGPGVEMKCWGSA
jgi:hypothetical protein